MIKNSNRFNRLKELIQSFLVSLPMSLSSKKSKKYFGEMKPENWFTPSIPSELSLDPLITWVGHSTFLIQIGGFNILVDPIFEDLLFLYKRNFPPGISLKNLPNIDFILISHNHRDHFHKNTILKLKRHCPIILIPKGIRYWFDKNGFSKVYENDYWDEIIFKNEYGGIKFSFLPAAHWAGQGFFDINKSVWGSWLISCNNKNIYFAGDSAYGSHFKDIAGKYQSIDLALIPISPCSPRSLVKESHLDPKEAVQAFLDLGAKNFIPMHWGTFRMTLDRFYEPIQLLKQSWNSIPNLLENKKLHILTFGQIFKV